MGAQREIPSTFEEKSPVDLNGDLGDAGLQRQKIIFLTSSEYGQANVILAVAYELLLRREYDIHIASFAPLQSRIKDLNALIPLDATAATFHTIAGPSLSQCLEKKDEFIGPYPLGIRGALRTYRVTLPAMATGWDIAQYMVGYQSCMEILRSVDADQIVIEPGLFQGLDACKTLSRKYVVLSPNTFQEILRYQQPKFNLLCRNPVISSGFCYPVPWYLMPTNIFLHFGMILLLVTSPKLKKLMSDRKSQSLLELPPGFKIWEQENHYILPSAPESEYPCHVPSNVTPCGPILLPVKTALKADPELFSWLERGPTILINLGSMVRMHEAMIREFASGLKIVLERRPEVRVLWKIRKSGGLKISSQTEPRSNFQEKGLVRDSLSAISNEIDSGRVKILEWISVDPMALLQSKHIVCSVHHGGSNSFHEALSAGVPQVILPCWLDTIDFANRVEWLGIGVHGSRNSAPSVKSGELSSALLKVLGNSQEAVRMRQKAQELANATRKLGGRKKACERIVELLEKSRALA